MQTRPSSTSTSPAQPDSGQWFILTGLILLAAALRLPGLGRFGFWRDEALSTFISRQQFPFEILASLRDHGHPPLYYTLSHFWIALAGESEFTLRLLSASLGILLIPAIYILGRRLFARRVGLVAAVLIACSPYVVAASRTARPYTLLPLVSLLSLYFLARALETDRRRPLPVTGDWLACILFSAAAIYTHTWGVFLIVAENAFFLAELFLRRDTRRHFWTWVGVQLTILALYAPWLPNVLRQAGSIATLPWVVSTSRWATLLAVGNDFLGLPQLGGRSVLVWGPLLLLGLVSLSLRLDVIRLEFYPTRPLLLVIAGSLGYVALGVLVTQRTYGLIPTYLATGALPGLFLLVARGLTHLRQRWLLAGTTSLLAALWLISILTTPAAPVSSIREVASYVQGHIQPDDLIVIAPEYLGTPFNYYFRGPQPQVAFPGLYGRGAIEVQEELHRYDRWLHAADQIQPTLDFVARSLGPAGQVWLIASLDQYPQDPYFSQVRVLKARLDQSYRRVETVSRFRGPVESADIFIYQR